GGARIGRRALAVSPDVEGPGFGLQGGVRAGDAQQSRDRFERRLRARQKPFSASRPRDRQAIEARRDSHRREGSSLGARARRRGFVVVGQQEIEWLDPRGKSFRHVQKKPPGDILMGIAQLGTVAAAEHVLWQQAKNSGWREIETEDGWVRVSPSGRTTLDASGRMTMQAFDRTIVTKTSGGTEPLFAAIRRS